MNESLAKSLQVIAQTHSNYISSYIDLLNKYIGYQRRVSTLRFERSTLIKYVKKLRFFNEYLFELELEKSGSLRETIAPLASFLIRYLELVDILNYYLTQSLKNEIISKTLNERLVLSNECIALIDNTYRHFVKFTQWMVESLEMTQQDLQIEVVQFARRCATEDGINVEESDDILLQEVAVVSDEEEYQHLLEEWSHLLMEKYLILHKSYDDTVSHWHEVFDTRR